LKVKNVLFIGSVLNETGLKKNLGVSAAATQWSKGLLTQLQIQVDRLHVLNHVWNRSFPYGNILPGNKEDLPKNYNTILARYINLKGIRGRSLSKSLYKGFKQITKGGASPNIIFFYNAYSYNISLAHKVRKHLSDVKLILIVLDHLDPEPDNWASFRNDTKIFDGCIFLSWWAYENAPIKNKIHIDSGWSGNLEKLPVINENEEIVFIYAGKMEKYGGITKLIEAIKKIPTEYENLRFEFYGKGESGDLIQLAQIDKRVHLKGFVSEKELESAFERANAFLSPLDLTVGNNKMVFPSKIMNYLRFQKPIIASKSKGISREYDDILFYVNDNDPNDWKLLIQKLLYLSLRLCKSSFEIKRFIIVENMGITCEKHPEFCRYI